MHFSKSHIIYIGIYGYLKILRLSCDTFNSYTLFYVRVPAYMWAFLGPRDDKPKSVIRKNFLSFLMTAIRKLALYKLDL